MSSLTRVAVVSNSKCISKTDSRLPWVGFVLFAALLLVFASPTAAKIYKWVDANGQVHYTDQKPEAKVNVETVNVQETNTVRSTPLPSNDEEVKSSESDDDESKIKAKKKTVVMYSAAWCGYCKKAREFMRANNISFREYDVEKSDIGIKKYAQLGKPPVPIIFIDNQRIQGFSPGRIKALYNQ